MRLKEIQKRMLEIRTALEGTEPVDLPALEIELKALDAEKLAIEARQKLIDGINVGAVQTRQMDTSTVAIIPKTDFSQLPDDEKRSLPEYRNAFLRRLQNKELNEVEKRVLTTISGATAAVPTETMNMIIDKLRQTSALYQYINVSFIGGNVSFTVANAKNDAAWKTEGADGTPADDTVAAIELTGFELIKLVEISAAAQVMTIPAFESYIVAEIARKMAIAIENAILNGTGSGQPTGILIGVTFVTGTNKVVYTTKISYDNVVDMTVLLPTMYHSMAKMIMTRAMALGEIRKVKDANGNPIFVPSTVAGQPATLLGYPVIIDDYMLADKILFGALEYYRLNFAKAIEIASDSSVGFKSGKITYRGLAVADGKPVLDEAFVLLSK